MPNDKYDGLYIHKELVKGSWYGICSGPKPQVFTGNIDDATGLPNGLEDIRNKALYIVSPSSENGKFPVYGHKSTVLTTRYGDNSNPVYLQRLFDIDAGVEWERAKIGSSSWYEWKRVTTEGDASATASSADTRSINNATAINQIDKAIGGRTANPNINSRVSSNSSSINSLNTDYNNFKNSTNLSIASLNSNVVKALDHSEKVINSGNSNTGIKFYAHSDIYIARNSNSVQVIPQATCDAWGCTGTNSVLMCSNSDGSNHEVHIEGSTYVPGSGWYALFDRTLIEWGVHISWVLAVFNQSII